MKHADVAILDYLYEAPGPRTVKKIRIATVISAIILTLLTFAVLARFYTTGQFNRQYWFFFCRATTWIFLGKGLLGTLESALLSGGIAFCLGFLLMLGRLSRYKTIRLVTTAVLEFTRGVPTLLLIYFFFLGLPALGIKMIPLCKIAIPVALSAAGVVAEVLRSGVNAVPKGQSEAALSLGMQERQVFFKVVFPQAFRYVIPSLIAEIVIVVKDTTFAYIVNFPDLMQNAKVLISNYDAMLSVYLLVAVLYILVNYGLNTLSSLAAHHGLAGMSNKK
ncbi:MAG: ABC transporter permease subunit [Treponema sp.]|nr:ABC transporter permease subunit [Treponema sp.]